MLVMRGQKPGPRGLAFGAAPLAVVVELPDHAWGAHAVLPVVQLFLDLIFDDLALLLDHEDLFQAFSEAPRALRLERPGERNLVHPQTDCARHLLGDSEIRE